MKESRVKITGMNWGLTNIYVDSRAAFAVANGTAQFPFRDLRSALTLCPEEVEFLAPGVPDTRTIQMNGFYKDLVIDRVCAIAGVYGLKEVSALAPLVILGGIGAVINLTRGPNGVLSVNGVNLPAPKFVGPCQGDLTNVTITEGMTLEGGGLLNLTNCNVYGNFTVPAEWTVRAFNTFFDGTVTGDIELNNSVIKGT